MQSLLAFLGRQSRRTIVVLGVALVVVLGLLDYANGWELGFSIFYLLPVALVAWFVGWRPAFAIACASAVVWMTANHLAGAPFSSPIVPVWNATVRLAFFLVVAETLVVLKRTVGDLRAAVERETVLARVDALTGLRNRRAFHELAEHELHRTRRTGRPLTLAYIDLDDFKLVNDTQGHAAGDHLLRRVAEGLRQEVRASDAVARLGGDEFALLLPETDAEAAQWVLRKVRQHLAESPVPVVGDGRRVTFSVGAVTFLGGDASVDALVQLADHEMYVAKRRGKNAIAHVTHGEPRPGSLLARARP